MNNNQLSQDNTTEGNRLIAEFCGAIEETQQVAMSTIGSAQVPTGKMYFKDVTKRFPDNMYGCKIDELKYHTSWDWLMPVVQKILNTDTGNLDVYSLYVSDSLRTADINEVWQACINFIEYYNTQTKTPNHG